MDDVARRRYERTESNLDVSPLDTLRFLLDAVERGEERPVNLLILFTEYDDDGTERHNAYRANVTKEMEVSMLEVAKHQWWLRRLNGR